MTLPASARAANAWRLMRLLTVGLVASILLTEASARATLEDETKDRELGALLAVVTVLDAAVWIAVDRRRARPEGEGDGDSARED